MNRIDLEGRAAVVTGAAQGIGYAITERLVRSGAAVALWDRDEAQLEAAKAALGEQGSVRGFVVDVTRLDEVESAVTATVHWTGALDILVCNAGITGPNLPLWEYPAAEWQRVLDVDLTGVFHCMRAVVPLMIERNYGRICSIASIAGKEGNPNASAYSAAKAGVIALTKSLGKELANYDIARELRDTGGSADEHLQADEPDPHRLHAFEDPARSFRRGRGGGRHGGVAGFQRELVRHRRRVRPQRWSRDLLSVAWLADRAQARAAWAGR